MKPKTGRSSLRLSANQPRAAFIIFDTFIYFEIKTKLDSII